MPDFKIDQRELKRYEKTLRQMREKAIPYAHAQTMNDLAFTGAREWRGLLPQKMQLRSRFLLQQIQVERASPRQVKIASIMGASMKADFMKVQEEGGSETKRGKHGIPVPAKPLGKRPMQKAKQFHNIKLLHVPKGGSRGQTIHAAMAQARKRGGPVFAAMRLRGGKGMGIYLLDPSRKRTGIRKVWSLHKSTVVNKGRPTMMEAQSRVYRLQDMYYTRALQFQLHRLGAK